MNQPPDQTRTGVSTLLQELEELTAGAHVDHVAGCDDPAAVLLALGDEIERLATVHVGKALALSERALSLADEAGHPQPRSRLRRARAQALAHAGRFDEALITSRSAAEIAQRADLMVEAARAGLVSVHVLARLGQYAEAVVAGEEARRVLAAAGEEALAARADVNIGATHRLRDDPRAALFHYDRARAALAHDPVALAQLETNRGIALISLDAFVAAEEAFQRAGATFAEQGLDWATAVAEGNLAYLATRQGNLSRALHHFERARQKLVADEAPADQARLFAEQADVLVMLGLFTDAVTAYEQVLPALERHGLSAEHAHAHAGLGRALMHLDRKTDADHALVSAAAAYDELGLNASRARLDLTRAELARLMGRPEEARGLIAEALDRLDDQSADAAAANVQMARIVYGDGDLTAAEAALARAEPTVEELDVAPLCVDLLHTKGLIRRARGDGAEALECFAQAVRYIERTRGTLQAERLRTAFLGQRLTVYEDYVRAALDARDRDLGRAFEAVEMAKSRALLDLVGGALDPDSGQRGGEIDPVETSLWTELNQLRTELNWWYGRLADSSSLPASTSDAWRREIHRREEQFDALRDRISVARGAADLFARPVDLAAIQRFIPSDTALLEYFSIGDELLAFVIRHDRVTVCRDVANMADVDNRVRRFHFQINRGLSAGRMAPNERRRSRLQADALREQAALFDMLIAPMREDLACAERLIVVPHGPLHTLPFHAFWDSSRGEPVIERWEISYAPSASICAQLDRQERHEKTARGAVIVAVPDEHTPRVIAEAQRVAASLRPGELLLGDEATSGRVIGAIQGAVTLHFACHGRFVVDQPFSSGLQLADRWLTVRDVYALRLSAELVTLSGCETGRSAVDRGDELLGLVRGFFAAAAPSLLVSLWTVDDDSTTDLMEVFYHAWRGGATKAAALRVAQRALLARQPHPAYWAPFILEGAA